MKIYKTLGPNEKDYRYSMFAYLGTSKNPDTDRCAEALKRWSKTQSGAENLRAAILLYEAMITADLVTLANLIPRPGTADAYRPKARPNVVMVECTEPDDDEALDSFCESLGIEL